MGTVNRGHLLEFLARLPARVWIQAALALVLFAVLAVLGFAVIAAVAVIGLFAILAFKARAWLLELIHGRPRPGRARGGRPVIDVSYTIVERNDRERP